MAARRPGKRDPRAEPRAQRVVATMAFALIGVSALAIVVRLVLAAVGVPDTALRGNALAVLALLPLPGLTLGLLLLIASIVLTAIRRART